MIRQAPTTATQSGLWPARMAGRTNISSTTKLSAERGQRREAPPAAQRQHGGGEQPRQPPQRPAALEVDDLVGARVVGVAAGPGQHHRVADREPRGAGLDGDELHEIPPCPRPVGHVDDERDASAAVAARRRARLPARAAGPSPAAPVRASRPRRYRRRAERAWGRCQCAAVVAPGGVGLATWAARGGRGRLRRRAAGRPEQDEPDQRGQRGGRQQGGQEHRTRRPAGGAAGPCPCPWPGACGPGPVARGAARAGSCRGPVVRAASAAVRLRRDRAGIGRARRPSGAWPLARVPRARARSLGPLRAGVGGCQSPTGGDTSVGGRRTRSARRGRPARPRPWSAPDGARLGRHARRSSQACVPAIRRVCRAGRRGADCPANRTCVRMTAMRWNGQQVGDHGVGAAQALPGLDGLLRTVRTPEFAGMVFHEVEARSALNRVPGVVAGAVPVDGQPVPRLRARLRLLPRGPHPRAARRRPHPADRRAAGGRRRPRHRAGRRRAPLRAHAGARALVHHASPPTPCASRAAPSWSPAASTASSPRTGGGTSAPGGAAPGGARTCGPGRRCSGPDRSARIVRRARRVAPAGYRRGYLCGLVRGDGPELPVGAPGAGGARPGPPPAGRGAARADHRRGRARPHRARRRRARRDPRSGVPARLAVRRPVAAASAISSPMSCAGPSRPTPTGARGSSPGVADACGAVTAGELRVVHADEEVVGRVGGRAAPARLRLRRGRPAPTERASCGCVGGVGALRALLARTGPRSRGGWRARRSAARRSWRWWGCGRSAASCRCTTSPPAPATSWPRAWSATTASPATPTPTSTSTRAPTSTGRSSSRSTWRGCSQRELRVAALARRAGGDGHQHRSLPARGGPLPADAGDHRRAGPLGHPVLGADQGHRARPGPAAARGRRGGRAGRRWACRSRCSTARCTPRWSPAPRRPPPGWSSCAASPTPACRAG